jgi:diaminopimelate epimerase
MKFVKMHGLGNDFVIVDSSRERLPPDPAELARRVCHRHFGIGADGLVLVAPGGADVWHMRIFNPDGSEAEMCGNALRCVARYLFEKKLVAGPRMTVATPAGEMRPEVHLEDGRVSGVRVDMGTPRLERADIPMLGPPGLVIEEPLAVNGRMWRVTAVSMGNPHCVIFLAPGEDVTLEEVGPALEHHPAFPRRTNVEFVRVLAPDRLEVRVWERGAGPTLACGTGACAALVAAALTGRSGRRAVVHLPGGDLLVEWGPNGHVYMTGPAEFVFEGTYLGPY